MRKSHFNDEFLVLPWPIIGMFFACSNEEKNKPKQQRVRALVVSLWFRGGLCFTPMQLYLRFFMSNRNGLILQSNAFSIINFFRNQFQGSLPYFHWQIFLAKMFLISCSNFTNYHKWYSIQKTSFIA
jgi:hypothetical protein